MTIMYHTAHTPYTSTRLKCRLNAQYIWDKDNRTIEHKLCRAVTQYNFQCSSTSSSNGSETDIFIKYSQCGEWFATVLATESVLLTLIWGALTLFLTGNQTNVEPTDFYMNWLKVRLKTLCYISIVTLYF